jgi:hypothetical protein
VWDPYGGSTARIGVEYGGGEDFRGRTLAIFRYEDDAVQAMTAARGAVEACPEEASDAESGATSVYETFDVGLGDQSLGWTQRYHQPDAGAYDTGLTVYHLVRVGPAIYASFEYSEAGESDGSLGRAVTHATDQARPIVEAMRDF